MKAKLSPSARLKSKLLNGRLNAFAEPNVQLNTSNPAPVDIHAGPREYLIFLHPQGSNLGSDALLLITWGYVAPISRA